VRHIFPEGLERRRLAHPAAEDIGRYNQNAEENFPARHCAEAVLK
jgi:hypothetical protein